MEKGKKWKLLWETWDLRSVILLSLLMQIFLIFSAPLRKRMSKAYIVMPMWLAYLLADATANFAVGLISKSQGNNTSGPFANPVLPTFWAPFLLVHLGGPDTITAFALEDNELWLRHLLGLGFQCWAVAYAFFQSFLDNQLWLPTVLMFIAGLIKYTERTRSLYLASSRRFRDSLLTEPDPGPNYAKLMDEYTSKIEARLPTKIEMIPEPSRQNRIANNDDLNELTDLKVVQCAHDFFDTFKGLIADLIFSFRERNQSRNFFLKRTPRDAFKVVEVELNFFYEILYTKVVVVQGILGCLFRIFSFSLTCASIVLFYGIEKKVFDKVDICITYTLLFGAIALDLVASLMVLYSDWTAVALTKSEHPNRVIMILRTWLNVDRERWPKTPRKPLPFPFGMIMKTVRHRWSESLSKYNLINYCLHPRSKWWDTTIDLFGLTNMLDGLKYVETVEFPNELRDLIFEELKMKSKIADDLETAKEIYSARGDWILRCEDCTNLLRWISEVDFDESLLLWHIATELCFNGVKDSTDMKTEGGDARNSENAQKNTDFRVLSKLLSDYMLYLLIMQPTMMSTVAGIGQIRFRDTCAEAKKFFHGRKIEKEKSNCCLNIFACGSELEEGQQKKSSLTAQQGKEKARSCPNILCCCLKKCCDKEEKGPDELQKKACESILAVNTAVEPIAVKGDRSKSVLFDACMLAKELLKLKGNRKWVIMSKVWVELLSYAACRCRATTHASQLSKGGQLITLVWLLMAHLGLGNQFQISEGHARAKLIVRK